MKPLPQKLHVSTSSHSHHINLAFKLDKPSPGFLLNKKGDEVIKIGFLMYITGIVTATRSISSREVIRIRELLNKGSIRQRCHRLPRFLRSHMQWSCILHMGSFEIVASYKLVVELRFIVRFSHNRHKSWHS